MRLSKQLVFVLTIIILISSCVESFFPKTTDYEDMLVIEGYLNDNPDVQTLVKLTRTSPLNSESRYQLIIENGALVKIECSDGTIYDLQQTGSYYSDPLNNIIPETGKSYRLIVETSDGNIFISDYQDFKASVPVDSITYSTREMNETDISGPVHGLQFYAHASASDNEPLFLRWVLDATYEYQVPFEANYIWGPGLIAFSNSDSTTCWRSYEINDIFLGSSLGLSENKVANARLNFVSQNGYNLSVKYSLHAKQYTISESAYSFWYDLNKSINETGGLYETIPFKINGNIICTTDPKVNFTGVFEVASTSEARVFATKPRDFNIYPPFCYLDTIGTESLGWGDLNSGAIISQVSESLFMTTEKSCFICTILGGTIHKPPFWE